MHVSREDFEKHCVNESTGETSFSTVIDIEKDGVNRVELHVDHVPVGMWVLRRKEPYQAGESVLVGLSMGGIRQV